MNLFRTAMKVTTLAFVCGFVATLSGCGAPAGAAGPLDANRTMETLSKALSAWKSGAAHNALSQDNPPIHVADEDWLSGAKLLDFVIDNTTAAQPIGAAMHHPVTLTLTDKRGRPVKRAVTYRVAVEPTASVIRED